jgi:hypothetical protein
LASNPSLANLRAQTFAARETTRGIEAGLHEGLRRRARVPAPEQKQVLWAERDEGVQVVGVVRPAGGDEQDPFSSVFAVGDAQRRDLVGAFG